METPNTYKVTWRGRTGGIKCSRQIRCTMKRLSVMSNSCRPKLIFWSLFPLLCPSLSFLLLYSPSRSFSLLLSLLFSFSLLLSLLVSLSSFLTPGWCLLLNCCLARSSVPLICKLETRWDSSAFFLSIPSTSKCACVRVCASTLCMYYMHMYTLTPTHIESICICTCMHLHTLTHTFTHTRSYTHI